MEPWPGVPGHLSHLSGSSGVIMHYFPTHTRTHTRPSLLLHQVFSTVLGTYFPCGRKYPLRGDWDSVSSSHVVLLPLYNP